MTSLDRLNDDCLVAVLRHLDMPSVIRASGANRWTRAVALGTPELWTDLRWTQSITPNTATDDHKDAMQHQRLETLSSRGCATDLRLTLALTITARPCTLTGTTSTTDRAQAAVTQLVTLLTTLRTRIVALTLDVSWPSAPNFLPTIDLDLPRLVSLDLRKTHARLVHAPHLKSVTYLDRGDGGLGSGLGPWGCGWPISAPVPTLTAASSPAEEERVVEAKVEEAAAPRLDEITELEVPLRIPLASRATVVPASADVAHDSISDVHAEGGAVTRQRGRSDGNGWLLPVLRAFPRLAHLRVWETAPHGPRSPNNHHTDTDGSNMETSQNTNDVEDDGDWGGGGACTPGSDDAEQDALEHRHILKSVDIRRSGLAARLPPGVVAGLWEHVHVGVHGIQNADDFLGLLSSPSVHASTSEASSSSTTNTTTTPEVTRIRFAARASADHTPALPFALGPRTSTVFALGVTTASGTTRSMSTLNRRVAIQALERVITLASPSSSSTLEVDGPFAWTALGDALRESARTTTPISLAALGTLTLGVRTVAELERVPPKGTFIAMPGLASLTLRAPSGVPLAVSREAVEGVLCRLGADASGVTLGGVGVVVV